MGSYDDWLRQRPAVSAPKTAIKSSNKKTETKKQVKPAPAKTETKKLSFNEQHELKNLPAEIEKLESQLKALETQMADPNFFKQEHKKVAAVSDELKLLQATLTEKYDRWEELEA